MQHVVQAEQGLVNSDFINGGVTELILTLIPRPVILVVEDEEVNRNFLGAAFARAGCQVYSAANGLEAIEAIENGLRPDLTITDLDMPVMGGEELLLKLGLLDLHLKILIVTGNETIPTGLEDKSFFKKPLVLDEILGYASKALGTCLKVA